MKKSITIWICVILIFCLMTVIISLNDFTQAKPIPESTTTNTPHDQIYINGNVDFATQAASEGWAGDGSAGNPP